MTPAKAIVRKAAQALYGAAYGKATARKARLAAVATIRTLAETGDTWRPEQLIALANEIEEDGQ